MASIFLSIGPPHKWQCGIPGSGFGDTCAGYTGGSDSGKTGRVVWMLAAAAAESSLVRQAAQTIASRHKCGVSNLPIKRPQFAQVSAAIFAIFPSFVKLAKPAFSSCRESEPLSHYAALHSYLLNKFSTLRRHSSPRSQSAEEDAWSAEAPFTGGMPAPEACKLALISCEASSASDLDKLMHE